MNGRTILERVANIHRVNMSPTTPTTNIKDELSQNAVELYQKFWNWRLVNFPGFATAIGEHMYDDKLMDLSLEGFRNRHTDSKCILDEVSSLVSSFKENNLSCTDLDVLSYGLKTYVEGFQYEPYLCAVNMCQGPHITIPYLLTLMPQQTTQHYKNILTRMRLVPFQVDKTIELMEEGMRKGITLHSCSVNPVLNQYKEILTLPENQGPFFRTFKTQPSNIKTEEWEDIVDQARDLIETMIYPYFQKFIDFLDCKYLAQTRAKVSVSSLPSGIRFYRSCLKYHNSTGLTPEQVHALGLNEVERIKDRIHNLLKEMNFQGSYKELIEMLKSDEVCSNEDIVELYSSLYDKILSELPKLFNSLPTKKCVIRTMTSSSSSVYKPGIGDRPGTFWLNANRVKGLSFTSLSLSLHEMIPGHHLQRNIIQEKEDTVHFRRFKETGNYWTIPSRFPLYTALMEGWAMYAEYLGEELELYKTPHDLFGRLYSELLRAARLVVDTGIHAFDWSKEKAVGYMMEIVGLEQENASLEVERYIVWPGQACSYKIGELKIKSFREMAATALGNGFNIKEFHDVILHTGEAPFEIIEENIRLYIASKKRGEAFEVARLFC